ncbi:hypothetical protein [Streptomyces sp. 8P21H-1]|uniref:hypothetical protein n=1 Tax=Streptomyces sp. 8P21H-1 TaxID=2737048 RepID=UPI001C2D225F
MRELSQGAFPQPPDNEPTAIQTARVQRRQAAATETAALRRARQERAAREPGAAGLRTTT